MKMWNVFISDFEKIDDVGTLSCIKLYWKGKIKLERNIIYSLNLSPLSQIEMVEQKILRIIILWFRSYSPRRWNSHSL